MSGDLGRIRLTFTDAAGRTTTAYAEQAEVEWSGPVASGGWALLPPCTLLVEQVDEDETVG